MRVRTKPIIVEAWENKPSEQTNEYPAWLLEFLAARHIHPMVGYEGYYIVNYDKNSIVVKPGDWIIRGDFDELTVCEARLFATYYEVVTEET